MENFINGRTNILVATTVIEVGVDVANSSVMVIENAERLGLTQLHQLRGRIGRGRHESICILLYKKPLSLVAKERLAVIRATNDGFLIAVPGVGKTNPEIHPFGHLIFQQDVKTVSPVKISRNGKSIEHVVFVSIDAFVVAVGIKNGIPKCNVIRFVNRTDQHILIKQITVAEGFVSLFVAHDLESVFQYQPVKRRVRDIYPETLFQRFIYFRHGGFAGAVQVFHF